MKKIIMKKIVASIVGLSVAGALSAAKNRFAPWWGELFSISCKGVHMYLKKLVASIAGLNPAGAWSAVKLQSLLLTLTLMVTAFWVSPAAAQKYVTDPTTGKVVTAPEYGGTLTYPYQRVGDDQDPFFAGQEPGWLIDGVNEKLVYGNWELDREEFDFRSPYTPVFAFTGNLAESWETPDPLSYIFHIRQGLHYALDPDSEASRLVAGRELTAEDVEHSFHRLLGLGDFTEDGPSPFASKLADLSWESITATDKWTVVFKLEEPSSGALRTIFQDALWWILPPEVIEKYGDYSDWKNVVGTGPFMLTDYVEGVSKTYTKNPDYWGYDEKYPENRLPYIDQLRALYMKDEATRLSALRTGKVDGILHAGIVDISSLDVVRSLQNTNPEIEIWAHVQRSFGFALNIRNAPFDDIRVRHAMQMALDLPTIVATYYAGLISWEPRGLIGSPGNYTPFAEWPAEIKQYYRYDPEGAEALLDEAGYPRGADGVRFKVDYQHRDIIDLGYFEIALAYLAEIGVDITINILDSATYGANLAKHNYEMSTGNFAFAQPPAWAMDSYRSDVDIMREFSGGVETPELTAAHDAYYAASTEEGRMKAFREFEMALVKHHPHIWAPMAPLFQANNPWVKGYNGEYAMGNLLHHTIYARLWIDQELKDRTQ